MQIIYNEKTGTFIVKNKKYELVFPPCRTELYRLSIDFGNVHQEEQEENGEASTSSGSSIRVNGDISPNDRISIHNDDLISPPSSSAPLMVNGHCSPSPSLSTFDEVFEINKKVKKGRGRPPKSKTLRDELNKEFRNPFKGMKPTLNKIEKSERSRKPNIKEPVSKKKLKQTSDLPATIKKVQDNVNNFNLRKTKILTGSFDIHGNKVSSTEDNNKLTSSENNNSDQNKQLPSISIPLAASSSTTTTTKAGNMTGSVPLSEEDDDDSLPWAPTNGITKVQCKKPKDLMEKIIENKNVNNKNGKRVNPPSLSIRRDEPVTKKPRKTLGLKLPLHSQIAHHFNSKVTDEITKKAPSNFKIPKRAPSPPKLILEPTKDNSSTSKTSRINLNSSFFKDQGDDELLGDCVDILDVSEINNSQEEIEHETESAVNGIESPVNGIESPVNGIESPVNGIESPVNGIESAVNGIESPVNGIESAVNGIESPVNGIESAVNGIESPVEQPTSESMDFIDCPVLQIPDSNSDVDDDIYNFSDLLLPPKLTPVSHAIMNGNNSESDREKESEKDQIYNFLMNSPSTVENNNNYNESNGQNEPEEEEDQIDNSPINSSSTLENNNNDNESNLQKESEEDKDQIDNSSTGENSNNDNDKNVMQERENSDNEDKEDDDEENDDDENKVDNNNGGEEDDDVLQVYASDDDDFGF